MGEPPFTGDVKSIKGLREIFRRRVGDCRIAFTVSLEEGLVIILRIGLRERIYEGT